MFKKIIYLAITVVLIFSVACAEPTERVSVFEFYELRMQRIADIKAKYGTNLETVITAPIVMEKEDCYTVNDAFGMITINKSDLTIESLITTLIDAELDQDEGYKKVINALITISSLEMDEFEADNLEQLHKMDDSLPEDVLMKYIAEYDSKIHPKLDSEKLETGEDIPVYQDNYDYYAFYRNYSGKGGQIYLIARVHE